MDTFKLRERILNKLKTKTSISKILKANTTNSRRQKKILNHKKRSIWGIWKLKVEIREQISNMIEKRKISNLQSRNKFKLHKTKNNLILRNKRSNKENNKVKYNLVNLSNYKTRVIRMKLVLFILWNKLGVNSLILKKFQVNFI